MDMIKELNKYQVNIYKERINNIDKKIANLTDLKKKYIRLIKEFGGIDE